MSKTSKAQGSALPAEFDPVWYGQTYADVAQSGLEAGAHYLAIGAALGRSVNAADLAKRRGKDAQETGPRVPPPSFGKGPAPAPPGLPLDDRSPINAPPPGHRAMPGAGLPPDRPMAQGETSLHLGGVEIGRGSDQAALMALAGPVRAYCVLTGMTGDLAPDAGSKAALSLQGPQGHHALSLEIDSRPVLRAGPAAAPVQGLPLAEAWFVEETRLRLMTTSLGGTGWADHAGAVLRVWQAQPAQPDAPELVGGMTLPLEGPGFCDLALMNPLMPLLLELSDPSGKSLSLSLLPFPSLLRGGLHGAELTATLPLGPPEEALWRFSEALLIEALGAPGAAPRSITALRVDPVGALGVEPVFSGVMQDWLMALFGLALGLEHDAAPDDQEQDPGLIWLATMLTSGSAMTPALAARRPADPMPGSILILAGDAVPSLQALVSRRIGDLSSERAGPFLVADRAERRGQWSVGLPLSGLAFLPSLQPTSAPLPCPVLRGSVLSEPEPAAASGPETETVPAPMVAFPLAIAYRDPPTVNEAELMMPVATDTPLPLLRGMPGEAASLPALSLALAVTDPALARATLSSLARQSGLGGCEVLLCPGPSVDHAGLAGMVREVLPEAAVQVVTGGLVALAQAARHDMILHLADTTVLHDPRSLSVLCALLAADDSVASASCLMLREIDYKGTARLQPAAGGLFPNRVSLSTAPRLIFAAPDCLGPLPMATWPVVANLLDLVLIRKAALLAAAPRLAGLWPMEGATDLAFGLAALGEGGCHLCTSVVRATTLTPATPGRDDMDPVSLTHIEPGRWDDLLGRVTLLQDLR